MKLFTTYCCAAIALCSAAYAQSFADHITVHFSTPVLVGETKIPAGDCDIQIMHGNSNGIVLILRSAGGPTTAAVASRLSDGNQDADGNASVVLNRHGNDLRLYRVLLNDHIGYQLNNAE